MNYCPIHLEFNILTNNTSNADSPSSPLRDADVEDELQQAEGAQQADPPGPVGFGQASPGPQPAGVHPPRHLPGPHIPSTAAVGGQPAPAAPPGHLRHLLPDGTLPHLHPEAPLPVGERAHVAALQATGSRTSAGECFSPWEPVDLRLSYEVVLRLGSKLARLGIFCAA